MATKVICRKYLTKVFFPKQYPIKKSPHFQNRSLRPVGSFPTVSTFKMARRRIVEILPPFIVLLLLSVGAANAEYRRFDGPVNAASNYVHYSEGYVVS